ncbi:proteophosphoglycan ppg4 [Rhodotorula toruloides]|uniref:Proteophosphoglycan ppg4 n=1 Tax=Rhodotorula toruloides TaxID=5286 RepID=A0A511KHI3_RHOTO|nr:proteophosphoglycan ppg4 [Rhodotorula toruloides]
MTKDIGLGLSPVLSPIHLVGSDCDVAESNDALSRAIFGGKNASSFASSFTKFQDRSSELVAARKSPISRRKTLSTDAAAPLSFANIASLSDITSAPAPSRSKGGRSAAEALDKRKRRDRMGRTAHSGAWATAFAKLEFPSFDIYIQKLSVTIGRRPVTPLASTSAAAGPSVPLSLEEAQKAGISLEEYILNLDPSALSAIESVTTPASVKGKEKAIDDPLSDFLVASPPPPSTSILANGARTSTSEKSRTPSTPSTPHPASSPVTDVDLGPLRAVSRQHARLYFDFDAGAWTIEVLGRNGVVVEGHWRAKGETVVLTKRTRIQIAERIFHFVLPTIDVVTIEPNGAIEAMADPAQGEKKAAAGTSRTKASMSGSKAGLNAAATPSDVDVDVVPAAARAEQAQPRPTRQTRAPEPLAKPASTASIHTSTSLPPLPSAANPHPSPASSSQAKPAGPSSRPPPPGKMPAGSPAPSLAPPSARPAPPPTPTAASRRPVRSTAKKPLPQAPKAASPAARASYLDLTSRANSEEMDAVSVEAARQRAAIIAQLLSGGAGPVAIGKNSLVRAAAEAKRAGKGKAPMRMAGKGPGKGKGLIPPDRRPSDLDWSDDEDDDPFASSNEDDSDDGDDGATTTEVEIVAAGQGGGKAVVKRSASVSTASASRAVPPPPAPSKAPRKVGKVPAKQPRQRRELPLPSQPETTASPAPAMTDIPARSSGTPALLSTLPALPLISPSPAADTPAALPALNLLPPLPPLNPFPSPAAPSTSLPTPPTLIASSKTSQPDPPIAPPPAKEAKSSKKKVKTEGTPAPVEASKPETSSAADKVNERDAAAPTKPRSSPYAPAPLPPGVPPPDAAPADNRNAKPPYTYASLIAQAINSSPAKKLTLHEIYNWVTDKWPYFLDNQKGWQNTIRHNLTPTRGFLKVVREKDDAGKGSFWEIDPTQMSNFDGHHYRKKPDGPTGGSSSNKAKAHAATKAAAAATAQITAAASQAPSTPVPPSTSKADPKASAPSNAPLSKPIAIIVAPIPDSYVRPSTPADGSQSTDELTAALLADPPIVLHEGKLILNPTIFSGLSEADLGELQRQPASAALQTLQAKVVQHFKDKMKNKSVHKFAAAAKAAASSSNGKPAASASPKTSAASLPSLHPLSTKAQPASKASAAPTVVAAITSRTGLAGAKAPRSAAALKASKAPKSASAALAGKRAREVDIDLTATAPVKPAKVAKKK